MPGARLRPGRSQRRRLALGASALATVTACGPVPPGDPAGTAAAPTTVTSEITGDDLPSSSTNAATEPTPAPSGTDTMTSTPPTPSTAAGSNDPAVRVAIADLAVRLGVATADIAVISVDEVTWRDASLGCPQPGINYTQALIDGRRIVLDVDGVAYAYHSGRDRQPFYCPAGRAEPPIVDPRI